MTRIAAQLSNRNGAFLGRNRLAKISFLKPSVLGQPASDPDRCLRIDDKVSADGDGGAQVILK